MNVQDLINMIIPRQLWDEAGREEFERQVGALIARTGGRAAVAARMRQIGLGKIVDSWMTEPPHEPISGEQLHQLFGTGVLRALAAKLDMQPRVLVRRLSLALPSAMARVGGG